MFNTQRSKNTPLKKYALIIPLAVAALTISSATMQAIAQDIQVTNQSPTQEKDWKDFYVHLKKSIRYPIAANESNTQGLTQTIFTVSNGQLTDLRSGSSLLGSGTEESVIRSFQSYPNYASVPDGKYSIIVAFTLSNPGVDQDSVKNKGLKEVKGYTPLAEIVIRGYKKKEDGASGTDTTQAKVFDFTMLDKAPEFVGGMSKFYEYLSRSVTYPAKAQQKKIQGKVYLSFVIEKDGSLTDIKVERGLGGGLDEESVRVLQESPKWEPGTKDGKPVRVKYNIPLSFTLKKG